MIKSAKIFNYFHDKKISNVKQYEVIKTKEDGEKLLFCDYVLKGEHGMSEICAIKITNIKFTPKEKICYRWDDNTKLWEEEEESVIRGLIIKCIEPNLLKMIEEYKEELIKTDNEYKKYWMKKISKSESALEKLYTVRTRNNIIKELRVKLMDKTFLDTLNCSKFHLPIKGGKIINLKNKEVRMRNKEDYFSFECKVEYIQELSYKHPNVDKLIEPIFLHNKKLINYVRRMLGMSMTENMADRQLYICYGIGRNGKSVLFDLMKKILGRYYISSSKDVFISSSKYKQSGSATSHLYALKNKRIAIFSETEEEEKLNMSEIKNITGGDEISCRELYGKQTEIQPVCKLWLLTNNPPIFDCADTAVLDRLSCIPFNARFLPQDDKDDVDNKKRFLADPDWIDEFKENHLNEFFTWVVDGCFLYFNHKDGNLKPECCKTALQTIINDIDSLQQFIDEQCEIDKTDKKRYTDCLYFQEKYDMFCSNNNIPDKMRITKNKLKKAMLTKGFKKTRKTIKDDDNKKKQIWVYKFIKTF